LATDTSSQHANTDIMSHSYSNVLIHCVFSTRKRRPLIPNELQSKLWRYLAGIGKNHKISMLECGGTADHVHVLLVLPSDTTLSKAVQLLKANSSRWLREHGIDFGWQEGYAAFSVSTSQLSAVREYIQNQAAHHRKRNFEEEFIALLTKSGVSYDPNYVFLRLSAVPPGLDNHSARLPRTSVLGFTMASLRDSRVSNTLKVQNTPTES
jgi:REP element-mobilizing transposase RayT